MTDAGPGAGEIVLEEEFPARPEVVWRALTTGKLIARWMGMEPAGFAPVAGARFTFQTTPAGAWDGIIHCEVLEAAPIDQLIYAWKSGHKDNTGYGSPLDTVVSFTLTPSGSGTRLRLVHSGFSLPRNQVAIGNMRTGWTQCAHNLRDIANDA